jgi:peptidoglycan LD-endopeptidase CwlK
MKPSRDVELLKPPLQDLCQEHIRQCLIQLCPLEVKVIQTLRTIQEQEAYFAQGRKPIDEVNRLRAEAGLSLITSKDNYIITNTMKSKHLIGEAYDIGIFHNGTYLVKPEHDKYYIECAEIGKRLGLECGAFWRKRDLPHYELLYALKEI